MTLRALLIFARSYNSIVSFALGHRALATSSRDTSWGEVEDKTPAIFGHFYFCLHYYSLIFLRFPPTSCWGHGWIALSAGICERP
jgi:hypothetical protein